MKSYITDQEHFWAGEFGDEYTNRNVGADWVASNTALFAKILARTGKIESLIEFGANIGLNLVAIKRLLPTTEFSAIEINKKAIQQLDNIGGIQIYDQSILNYQPTKQHDFVLIKGVLIHINPDHLLKVYDSLYQSSQKYICIAEYYNPTPIEIGYRGQRDKLFKRDFAGEMLDRFNDLQLWDYGFSYHRDPFPQDDITWFLLKKE